MRFFVQSIELQKALASVGSVIPSKSTLPILENFLFEISKDKLTIAATDLDTSISMIIPVKNSQEGKIAVPAKRLSETIRALPNTEVEFSADVQSNKILLITRNEKKETTGEYKLTGETSDTYPSIPAFKGDRKLKMDNEALRRLITKTSFAVSADELRPAMTGILFQIKKKEIRAVATDGHRLVRLTKSDFASDVEQEVVVPAKALNIVAKSAAEGESIFSFNENNAMLAFDNTSVVSRMI